MDFQARLKCVIAWQIAGDMKLATHSTVHSFLSGMASPRDQSV